MKLMGDLCGVGFFSIQSSHSESYWSLIITTNTEPMLGVPRHLLFPVVNRTRFFTPYLCRAMGEEMEGSRR
jgi:hypothetical protein